MKNFLAGKDGVYEGIPDATYHAIDRISNSGLSRVKRSLAHYRYSSLSASSDALIFGRAFHAANLTPKEFEEQFVTFDGDRRTKEGKDAWAKMVEQYGENVLKQGDLETILAMRISVFGNPTAKALLESEGPTELSLLWNCEGVDAKARIDKYIPEGGILVDLKTTRNAHPEAFAKSIVSYGYHRQAAFYLYAAASAGLAANRFLFVAIEKEKPYGCGVYELSYNAIMQGHAEILELIAAYKDALETDEWPSYGTDVITLDLPRWAQTEDEDDF